MSRASWSSTGSDAEVQHHFDQPFNYEPRLDLNPQPTRGRRHGSEDADKADSDQVVDDSRSTADSDAASIAFSESFQAALEEPVNETFDQPTSRPLHFLDDSEDQTNQAICRICLESASSDVSGGESLGRLLSPCRCKGTMKYVHATCLDQWRAASARSSSAVACDQCGAPYRFRKSKFVGLATSPTLLFVVSLVLFLVLIWTVGVAATFFMDIYERPSSDSTSATQHKLKSKSWWPWRASDVIRDPESASVEADAWSYLDVDYTPGPWGYSSLMYEPAAYVKLIKQAVRSFATGEAVEAVKEAVGLQDGLEEPPTVREDEYEERGFWSALKHEWMYGDGGLWEKRASPPSQQTPTVQPESTSSCIIAEAQSTPPPKAKPREKYDARAAADYDDSREQRRRRNEATKAARPSKLGQVEPQGWLNKLLIQFSVGFSLVGILSFVNLLVGASFIGPINLHNFGLGRSFARMTSGGRGRNGNQEGVNIASILLVLLVIIGVVRALHVVYKLVRKAARRGLSRLEAVIVDWQYEDDADVAPSHVVTATHDARDHEPQFVRQRHAFGLVDDD